MRKQLIPIYIAAAALILVGAFYLFGSLRYSNAPAVPSPSPVPSVQASGAAGMPGWKAYEDPQGRFSFRYPESLGTHFIGAQQWPPSVTASRSAFSCAMARSGSPVQRMQKAIGDRTYCITLERGAAAGTTYDHYTYATGRGADVISLDFTLRFPQCANYDEPNRTRCADEENSFDLDTIVDTIMQSVQIR